MMVPEVPRVMMALRRWRRFSFGMAVGIGSTPVLVVQLKSCASNDVSMCALSAAQRVQL